MFAKRKPKDGFTNDIIEQWKRNERKESRMHALLVVLFIIMIPFGLFFIFSMMEYFYNNFVVLVCGIVTAILLKIFIDIAEKWY